MVILGIQLPRSRPSVQGVTQTAIKQFFQQIQERRIRLHSMMLVRHGHVVAEHWWKPFGPEKRHKMFSLSKSFTSTAIGFAVTEGLLTEDDLVVDFFPEAVTESIRDNLQRMKIRHLLSMSTGHVVETMPSLRLSADGDWVRAFLNVPIEREPGTYFLYNTGATYMLSAILQKVAGQDLLSYLTPRLFEPLGILDPTWETCPRGIPIGGFGLSIRTEDIAKFGQLYLQRGLWHGQQLIPESWVETATRKHVDNQSPNPDWSQGYGYQFWRCQHNAYRGDGKYGQYCVVMPQLDAVLAITSSVQDLQEVLDVVWETLLPGMDNKKGKDTDTEPTEALHVDATDAIPGPVGVVSTIACLPPWVDKTITVEPNILGIDSMKFESNEHAFAIQVRRNGTDFKVQGDLETWVEQRIPVEIDTLQSVALQGGWRDEETLRFALCFSETPYYGTVDVSGDHERVVVNVNGRFDNAAVDRLVMTGKVI